jgi:hypothetical protein
MSSARNSLIYCGNIFSKSLLPESLHLHFMDLVQVN